jgi:hypothetical protein
MRKHTKTTKKKQPKTKQDTFQRDAVNDYPYLAAANIMR